MFGKGFFNSQDHQATHGFIWSLEGDHYLAFQKNEQGDVIKQAHRSFRSLVEAKQWLRDSGITNVMMEQSNAYFEMIGQDQADLEMNGYHQSVNQPSFDEFRK